MVAIKLCAKNDINGNPRRVFVVLDDMGSLVEAIDEGYNGTAELFAKYPDISKVQGWPIEFATTPAEYRRLLKGTK